MKKILMLAAVGLTAAAEPLLAKAGVAVDADEGVVSMCREGCAKMPHVGSSTFRFSAFISADIEV